MKLDQSMASMGKCTFESNHFHSLMKEQNHDYLFYCPRQKQNPGLVTKKSIMIYQYQQAGADRISQLGRRGRWPWPPLNDSCAPVRVLPDTGLRTPSLK